MKNKPEVGIKYKVDQADMEKSVCNHNGCTSHERPEQGCANSKGHGCNVATQGFGFDSLQSIQKG